jgi:hypothetical protein
VSSAVGAEAGRAAAAGEGDAAAAGDGETGGAGAAGEGAPVGAGAAAPVGAAVGWACPPGWQADPRTINSAAASARVGFLDGRGRMFFSSAAGPNG